jgi:hypothetical protein
MAEKILLSFSKVIKLNKKSAKTHKGRIKTSPTNPNKTINP